MNDTLQLAIDGAWRVLAASLVFGAGLPLVFALGIRALAWGTGGDAEVSHAPPHHGGKAVAALCLLVVVAGIVTGITMIAAAGFGKAVSFEHVYPTVVPKD